MKRWRHYRDALCDTRKDTVSLTSEMKPRIGITCSYSEPPVEEDAKIRLGRYIDTVGDAGGVGELMFFPTNGEYSAAAERLIGQLDGLIISGGADLPTQMFGEDPLPEANLKLVVPQRPEFELALLHEFIERGKPVFGICYGCQLMNVWAGGSLIQDIALQIPQAIEHRGTAPGVRHSVRVKPNTRLHRIVETEEFECVSSHHQALAHIASDEAIATSHAPDGIVESLEFLGTGFHWGVQWHPECDRESEATQRIFAALVKACVGRSPFPGKL